LCISGEQVKHLLMKSGLPMPVLGHIWYVVLDAMHYVTVSTVSLVGSDPLT